LNFSKHRLITYLTGTYSQCQIISIYINSKDPSLHNLMYLGHQIELSLEKVKQKLEILKF
jgi:hypothetical protein